MSLLVFNDFSFILDAVIAAEAVQRKRDACRIRELTLQATYSLEQISRSMDLPVRRNLRLMRKGGNKQ